jgi:hypothetical protein
VGKDAYIAQTQISETMYVNVTDNTPVAMLTVGQLKEILQDVMKHAQPAPEPQPINHFQGTVRGIKGIRDLFDVSHATAYRYKNTILAPAVKQNGRVIITDVAKALELFGRKTGGRR